MKFDQYTILNILLLIINSYIVYTINVVKYGRLSNNKYLFLNHKSILGFYNKNNNLYKSSRYAINVDSLVEECKRYIKKLEDSENFFDQSSFVANFYGDKPSNEYTEEKNDVEIKNNNKIEKRKRNKTSSPVVFRISYNTDIGDVETKVQLARKQLEDRNLVVFKMNLKYIGNNTNKKPPIFDKIIELLRDIASPTGPISSTDRFVMLTLKNKLPINKKAKQKTDDD